MSLHSPLVEEGLTKNVFSVVSSFCHSREMWCSSSYMRLVSLAEGMKDSSQLGFSSNHLRMILPAIRWTRPLLPQRYQKCLSSCWCNCLSINPRINRVCHPKPGLTLMQLCRCDYPVYCIYKCLIIYLIETLAHQPFYRSCSRWMHIQGFCYTLFRLMWKRVARSLGFFSLTYLVLFLTI